MRLLLFDMDNVLVLPLGYQRALADTVAQVSLALGLPRLELGEGEVASLEACGATSEWDSAAICAALSLVHAWRVDPGAALPVTPPLPARPPLGADPVDLGGFLARLQRAADTTDPRGNALEALIELAPDLDDGQRSTVKRLLADARSIERSLTHRLFQERALGSKLYQATYGLPATEGVATGYLISHDRPGLDEQHRARLGRWLADVGHGAAVLTNRPSLAPDGASGTPEAEQGVRVAGLPDLPIIGLGGLRWLARRRGAELERFLKPSPVHALAALLAASGARAAEALEQAALLAVDGRATASWNALDQAVVWVFEDSDWGLHSAAVARDLLEAQGVALQIRSCGVTASPPKRVVLRRAGATVFSDLDAALDAVDDL